MGCHFLLQCMKVKSESEVAQSCPTPSDPMDCSLPGPSVHGIFQARVLEWVAIAFSVLQPIPSHLSRTLHYDYSLALINLSHSTRPSVHSFTHSFIKKISNLLLPITSTSHLPSPPPGTLLFFHIQLLTELSRLFPLFSYLSHSLSNQISPDICFYQTSNSSSQDHE